MLSCHLFQFAAAKLTPFHKSTKYFLINLTSVSYWTFILHEARIYTFRPDKYNLSYFHLVVSKILDYICNESAPAMR